MHELFKGLIDWYKGALETGGYPLVALLMALESSLVPLPSEAVIPLAAHIAYSQEKFVCFGIVTYGKFAVLAGIVIAGAIGSWVGATVMYWASRLAGRPLVLKYGRYILIPEEKVHGAEHWAQKFGPMGIFISRLLPVVRHLIGIPAGIVKMDYRKFSIYTLLGSAIWCAVLCWMGVRLGGQISHGQAQRASLEIGGVFLLMGLIYYFFVHRHMRAAPAEKSAS